MKGLYKHKDRSVSIKCLAAAALLSGLGLPLLSAAEELPGPTTPSLTLGIEDAISRGLEFNRRLLQLTYSVKTADRSVTAAKAEFAPRIAPDSSLGYSGSGSTASYGIGAAQKLPYGTELSASVQLTDLDTDAEEDKSGMYRVSLSQPLFRRFGKLVHWNNVLLADSRFRESQRALERARADLVVDIVRAYEAIIRLENQKISDESLVERLHKLYRLTSAREKQGHTTRVDTLRVELQLGQARSRLEATLDQLFTERQNLAELLGDEPDTLYTLLEPPLLEFELPDKQTALQTAFSNRLDFAQVLENAGNQLRALKIARKTVWPDLSLNARYEESALAASSSEAFDFEEDDWFVGLSLGSDINIARDMALREQAAFEHQRALEEIDIQRIAITRSVQQQLSTLRKAQAEYRFALKNRDLANRRAKLARRMFEQGRGDNFSVTDAEEAFFQAENSLFQSKAGVSVNTYRLLREMGTIIDYPDALKPGSFLESL